MKIESMFGLIIIISVITQLIIIIYLTYKLSKKKNHNEDYLKNINNIDPKTIDLLMNCFLSLNPIISDNQELTAQISNQSIELPYHNEIDVSSENYDFKDKNKDFNLENLRFCQYCGREITINAYYCSNCGNCIEY